MIMPQTQMLFETAMAILTVVRSASSQGREPTQDELDSIDIEIAKKRRQLQEIIQARAE